MSINTPEEHEVTAESAAAEMVRTAVREYGDLMDLLPDPKSPALTLHSAMVEARRHSAMLAARHRGVVTTILVHLMATDPAAANQVAAFLHQAWDLDGSIGDEWMADWAEALQAGVPLRPATLPPGTEVADSGVELERLRAEVEHYKSTYDKAHAALLDLLPEPARAAVGTAPIGIVISAVEQVLNGPARRSAERDADRALAIVAQATFDQAQTLIPLEEVEREVDDAPADDPDTRAWSPDDAAEMLRTVQGEYGFLAAAFAAQTMDYPEAAAPVDLGPADDPNRWRPIAEAPRDGTAIEVGWPGTYFVMVGPFPAAWQENRGWAWVDTDDDEIILPALWRPLPPETHSTADE